MAHGKSDPLLREGATKAIGARLKWCRKEHWHRVYHGIHPTQAQLAKLIGIGESTVTKHEGGVNAPNAVLAIKYGRYYHVDSGWLLCGAATHEVCWPEDWNPPEGFGRSGGDHTTPIIPAPLQPVTGTGKGEAGRRRA